MTDERDYEVVEITEDQDDADAQPVERDEVPDVAEDPVPDEPAEGDD